MPITSFTTDFSNRTLDINVLKVASYTNNQTQVDTVGFGNPSQYITGIGKLVQKYAISLMTALGSQVNSPTFGTNFIPTLQSGTSSISKLDLLHLFNFANLNVLGIFRTYQANNPSIPTDEQLQSAQLVSSNYADEVLNLSIAITSVAGDNVVFVLPIPLN